MSGLSEIELRTRKDRITASSVAAYLGYLPYQSPLEAWEINAGLQCFTGNNATEIGQAMESAIAERVRNLEGLRGPMIEPLTIVHQLYPWWCATPDRLFPESQIGLEIKNHEPHMIRQFLGKPGSAGEWDNDLIPIYHHMQVQWEMAATASLLGREWKAGLLAAYFGGSNLRVYRIRRHEPFLKSMTLAAFEFWKQHLDPAGPRTPPDNATWQKEKAQPRRAAKLKDEELLTAPIPFLEKRSQ